MNFDRYSLDVRLSLYLSLIMLLISDSFFLRPMSIIDLFTLLILPDTSGKPLLVYFMLS
jgi:hypothetical protein